MAFIVGELAAPLSVDDSKFEKGLNDAKKKGQTFAQGFSKGLTDVGKSMTKNVTVPLVAVGGIAVKASIDFESAFAGVKKTVEAPEEELAKLSAGIRDMAKEIPAAATDIAAVAEAAGQLGIETPNILSFTRTMVDLGESTNMSSDQAATALARMANITGMAQTDFDRLGSTIVALGNNLATTESEIVDMSLNIAGAGKQVGMTEAQIMSFAGALSSVGIEAQAGGSSISRLMVDMQLAVETGGGALKDFAKVAGMSAKDFQKAFKDDAAGAIVAFIQGLSNAEKQGSSAIKILNDMGITEIRLRDALLRAAGAGDLFNRSIEIGTKAWTENTALTTEAQQRYATTASKLAILKNRVTDVAMTVGGPVVDAMMSALDAAEPFFKSIEAGAKAFSAMDKSTQKLILGSIATAAALGPVALVGGKVVGGVTKMADGLGKVSKLFLGTKAAATAAAPAVGGVGVAASGAVAPLLLVASGIVAATAAGYGLYKHMKQDAIPTIREFGDTVSDSTAEALSSFYNLYDETTNTLRQLQWSGGKLTQDTATTITTNFNDMASQIATGLEQSRIDSVAAMQDLFRDTEEISEERQAEMLESLNKSYDDRITAVNEKQKRIEEIIAESLENAGIITDEAWAEINKIEASYQEEAIYALSKGAEEMRLIREQLAKESEAISARQAADIVKKAIEERNAAVAEAKQMYEDKLKWIISQRDDVGAITAEEADLLIGEAERQYEDAVGYAEDMYADIIELAQKQSKDHVDEVDWETGEILSKWEVFARRFVEIMGNIGAASAGVGTIANPPSIKAPSSKSSKKSSSSSSSTGSYRVDRLQGFASGGIVGGAIGSPQIILAHGGEEVTSYQERMQNYRADGGGGRGGRIDVSGTVYHYGINDEAQLVAVVEERVIPIVEDELRRLAR